MGLQRAQRSTSNDTRGPTPLDSLWEWRTILRLLVAAQALAVILTFAPGLEHDRWRYFLLASLTVQWVVLLALGLLYLLRHELARRRPVTVAYIALLMLLVSTLLVAGAAALLNGEAWVLMQSDPSRTVLRLLTVSLIAGVLAVVVFRSHWTSRQLAVQAKQAQLEALRARVQPHFLFNTLNTAVALVRAQPDKAEQVLLDLADLFRAALASPGDVPLADELDNVKRYLEIEALRLGSRLRLAWNVPPDVPDIDVPNLSLQPLAENAIRHGVEPSATGGELIVEVSEREGRVLIVIANSLSGATTHAGHRVGLPSSRERIEAAVSGAVFYAGTEDGRHVVRIELPSRIK